jgi:hypothetical protein
VTRWEYARLESGDSGISVLFTHRESWTGLAPEAFFETLRRLGDEGWELVAALPLGAVVAEDELGSAAGGAASAATAAAGGPGASGAPRQDRTRRTTFRLVTDRWLVFKRPQPEAAAARASTSGEDVLKGLVGRHLLQGRLPLP